jgi:hypothetical protein
MSPAGLFDSHMLDEIFALFGQSEPLSVDPLKSGYAIAGK